MRTVSVLVPRSTSHESIGPRIAPAAFCTNFIHSTIVLVPDDDDAADAVAVAVQELRRAVHDDVGAERQRPLDVRAGERVVDDHADVVPVRDVAARTRCSVMCSIGLVGVSMNRYLVFGVIAGSISSRLRRVDVGEVEPELAPHALEQPERAAVGVVADDEVVARLEPGQDGVDGRHARGEGERRGAGFDGREVALERHARRVLRAAVFEALVAGRGRPARRSRSGRSA